MAEPAKKTKGHSGPAIITEAEPRSMASEAYRTLRTNIRFASLGQPCRTILITSASAGEGKTTTAANFAVVSAQTGSRVCLVDADLRHPTLHRLFGLENTRGLTTALVENLPFAKVAQPTRIPNLAVLTSGPSRLNPAELVGSKQMRELLEGATSDFDLILCDSPPIISVADSIALSAQCDAVVLVVRAGRIPYEVIRRAAEQIEAVKGRILGVLLNCVNLQRDGDYYEYYRHYHAYYSGDKKR